MRIRPGGAPTLSQLQLCDAFFDWGAPATISNTAHVISIPSYRFTVQSMTQMQVVTQLSAEDFKLSGEMVARKLSNDPSGSLGFITISASTIDLEEGEVTLFSKQKFAVSCFSEMESHDRERSIFNIFREIIPGLPVAMISASHSMQVAFNNHYMKVDSETLVGPGAPEGHMVTLYKDANPSDDDIPSSKTFSTMGGRPQNFMSHLYDQTPQLNSVFRFEGVNIQGAHPPVAEGTLVLDVGASSERRNELHQPTLPR